MILVIGSSNTDMVVKTPRFCKPGETILGGAVTFVNKLGNDIFGQNAIACYQKEGIETGNIFIDESIPSGANHSISVADIDNTQQLIDKADIILLQLEIPLPVVGHVMKLAKQQYKKLILNPAPAQALPDPFFEKLFAITPNETEAEILTGIKVKDKTSAATAAKKLLDKGVENVLITLGKCSSVCLQGSGHFSYTHGSSKLCAQAA